MTIGRVQKTAATRGRGVAGISALHSHIEQCSDIESLEDIIDRARARVKVVRDEIGRDRDCLVWDVFKKACRGHIIVATRSATFPVYMISDSGNGRGRERPRQFRAGSTFPVYLVQEKRKRLWVESQDGELICLNADQLSQLAARLKSSDKPTSSPRRQS